MNLIVHQSIVINQLKVGGISNSSILQIGCAGMIKARSNLYNTGQFTGPAPQAGESAAPLVPLPAIT
ncbi:MAG: spore germination protein [Paenibacillus sp.]|jgi:spore germination protein PB|nr:spore germination protein [Paenibacillus sp.]